MLRFNLLTAGIVGLSFLALSAGNVDAAEYSLSVDRVKIDTGEFTRSGIGYNGKTPGPVLRFKEGEDVTIKVTNNLNESTSIHWHGLILPYQQDGVPGISYDGIDQEKHSLTSFRLSRVVPIGFIAIRGFRNRTVLLAPSSLNPKNENHSDMIENT